MTPSPGSPSGHGPSSWTHEEFLAACLQREVSARESHGGEGRSRIRACQAGHRAAFATAAEWVARLADAHHGGRLQDELTRLSRIPVLILDEVGYIPVEAEAANLFFQLVSSQIRASQADRDQQQALQTLGRGLR